MCTLCRVKQPKMNNRIYFSKKKRKNLQPIKRETHRDRWRTMKWGQLQERSLLIHLLRVDPWLCFSSSAGLNDPLRLFSALYPMIWAIFFFGDKGSCGLKNQKHKEKRVLAMTVSKQVTSSWTLLERELPKGWIKTEKAEGTAKGWVET